MPDSQLDVITIGETMVAFVSRDGSTQYQAVAAGAESNVAIGLARLGLSTRWVSRLGDDRLGSFIESTVTGAGVDAAVVRDAEAPTGVMVKHVSPTGSTGRYYRRGSAASRLSAADLDRAGSARWMHVTGITPALSPTAAALVEAVLDRTTGHAGGVSFDVNYRPALWSGPDAAAAVLRPLARQADVVFVGDDEAEALFGTTDFGELAGILLDDPQRQLVLKHGAAGAEVMSAGSLARVPGLSVDAVDETGAGDAFAAGYLAANLAAWDPEDRLRLGHVMGSRVVQVIEDVPPPFADEERAGLSPGSLAEWWNGSER